ncbi:MAG: hypothetical protein HY841_15040 [Bacteroidetes bacterium]|nr:hypothetical protein [Bacteroidota bacterium]
MRIHCLLPTAYCLLSFFFSFSQSNQNIPLYREKLLLYEKQLNSKECTIHTSIKPFNNTKELDALSDSIIFCKGRGAKGEGRKKSSNIISANGIFSSEFGYESRRDGYPQATTTESKLHLDGGLSLEGKVKDKLSFNAAFMSGNSSFPSYIDTFISKSNVVPGMGSAYTSPEGMDTHKQGYSYHYYSGYLSYSPNKIFNFQIGKDKHFWGDGYRSLFLSDVSNSFPFLKLSTTIWKFKYVNLFAWMKDVTNPTGFKKDFLNKYGTFHYLSWNATKRINVALFESIIWQGSDNNRSRGFDINYLNPIIFYRPVEYSLGSSDNAFLGFSFKLKVAKKQQFYGQIILDEFLLKEIKAMNGWWGNKQGFQFGFKSFDLFTLKNLSFQTEINAVRPYTYSHGSVQQNYANYNQPLAHPLGANFAESVSFLNYRYKKFVLQAEFLYANYGKDKDTLNYGGNIFISYIKNRPNDYGNKFFQGLKTNLLYTKLKVSYYLIPSADLLAEAGVALRQEKNSASALSSSFFFIGIKTGIMNRYSDF